MWLLATLGSVASANTVHFGWDPVDDSRVALYQLAHGTVSGIYDQPTIETPTTEASVANLQEGLTYYFVVRACDAAAVCSDDSNEVVHTVSSASNFPPESDAGGPYNAEVGQALVLDGSHSTDADGNVVAYAWDFGDGNVGSGAQPTHTYTAAGSYEATLTVADNESASNSATAMVTVVDTSTTGGGDGGSSEGDGSGTLSGLRPVAYWPLDASSGPTAFDQQGANDLTVNGAQWQPSGGEVEGALYFGGTNDYAEAIDASLSVAMPGSSSGNGGDFTLAAWINPERLDDRQPILSKQGTIASGPRRAFMFGAGESDGSGKLYFEVFKDDTSGGKTSLASTQALKLGQWQHVAVTYDHVADGSSIITLFIDGEQAGRTTAAVGPIQANGQPLNLGRYYWSSSYQRYFQGLLDEVYVFAEALGPAEIHDLAFGTVNQTPVNQAPEASDDTATVTENSTDNTLTVLANDSDPDGDELTVTDASAANGTVLVNADGTLSYTPNADFYGTDTVSYSISDGAGGSDTATVTVSVTQMYDAPVASFTADKSSGVAPLLVTFEDTSKGEVSSRKWVFGDGTTDTDATQITHTYTVPGTYSVQLTVTGPGGTGEYLAVDLIVVEAPITDGGDGPGTGSSMQPVAYWALDASSGSTAFDQQGANDLAVNDAQWQPSLGQVDGALYLDGVNGYAEASDASLMAEIPGSSSDSTGDFTLAAWIKPERLDNRQPILSKQGTTANGPRRAFMFSAGEDNGSGKLYFEVYKNDTSGGKTSLTSNQALTVGQWQHVAVTYRYETDGNSTITLYIDGEEAGRTTTAVGPIQANFQPLDLGRYYWSAGYQRYFQGLIDEVQVFNEALGPADIEDLIHKLQPVAYWALDASSGSTAFDQQGANDLTLNDAQWQPSLGQVDGALYLDGVNGYAEASDASLMAEIPGSSSDGTGDFTLAAWIKPERLDNRQPILSKQGTTASGPRRAFMFSAGEDNGGGKLYVEVFKDDTSDGKTSLTSNQALTVGQWQHVAVTYRYETDGSSTIALYIDGEEAGRTTEAVGPMQANFQPLDLGRYYWSAGYQAYFQGLIDEVQVFAEALSPADIQDLSQ